MRTLTMITEKKRKDLEKLIENYGIDDPMVIKESQLLDVFEDSVRIFNNKFLSNRL
jgi:hypothetical protein